MSFHAFGSSGGGERSPEVDAGVVCCGGGAGGAGGADAAPYQPLCTRLSGWLADNEAAVNSARKARTRLHAW